MSAEPPRAPRRFPLQLDALRPPTPQAARSPVQAAVQGALRTPTPPLVPQAARAAALAEAARAPVQSARTPAPPAARAPAHGHVHAAPLAQGQAAHPRVRPPQAPGADGRHLGMDSADVRRGMVARLREAGIRDERVLDAMAQVPRHRFVDGALVTQAYEDTSLPIGHGQTISKPSVVARMIELLLGGANNRRSGRLGRVLEIGTGCGYQAAVLATLGSHVISVERLRPLHEKARELLGPLRPPHLRLVYGDGMRGHPPNAPYDSIIAAAGGDAVPGEWIDQLAIGGRLVAPSRQPGTDSQVLVIIDRHAHGIEQSTSEGVHFVPLKSGRL